MLIEMLKKTCTIFTDNASTWLKETKDVTPLALICVSRLQAHPNLQGC